MKHETSGDGGFTLLEVLVVLVVFSLLQLALWEGLHLGLAAWKRQVAGSAALEQQVTAEAALRRLIARAQIGDPEVDAPVFCGEDRFLFVSSLDPGSRPGPGVVSLSQKSEPQPVEVTIGRDRAHRLVMRWRPWISGEALAGEEPYREAVLLDHVDTVTFRYQMRDGHWLAHCPDGLPVMAVRLHIEGVGPFIQPDIAINIITGHRWERD